MKNATNPKAIECHNYVNPAYWGCDICGTENSEHTPDKCGRCGGGRLSYKHPTCRACIRGEVSSCPFGG